MSYLIVRQDWNKFVGLGEPAVESLIQALKHNDNRVRREAASTLGEIGDKRAVEPLTQALKDEDKEVRKATTGALEKIKAKKS